MVSKLTKNPEKRRTGMAVTGPTKVATWKKEETNDAFSDSQRNVQGWEVLPAFNFFAVVGEGGL